MLPDLLAVTIDEMIKEAEREMAMRQRLYPMWVETKRMTQATADKQTRALSGILKLLYEQKGKAP